MQMAAAQGDLAMQKAAAGFDSLTRGSEVGPKADKTREIAASMMGDALKQMGGTAEQVFKPQPIREGIAVYHHRVGCFIAVLHSWLHLITECLST